QTNPSQSLQLLKQAEQLCEQAEHLRPRVFYEMGFTYKEMQSLAKAVKWYERAKSEAISRKDTYRLAFILNDMGFAHSVMGDHTRAYILVDEARVSRQERLAQLVDSQQDKAQTP